MPRFALDGSSQEMRERLADQTIHQPPSQDTLWVVPRVEEERHRLQQLPMNVPTPSPPDQTQINDVSSSSRQAQRSNENPTSDPSHSHTKRNAKALQRKSLAITPTLGELLEAARANPKLAQGGNPAEQSSAAQTQSRTCTSVLTKALKPSASTTHPHAGGSHENAQNAPRHGEEAVSGSSRRINLSYAEVSKKGKARAGPSMPGDTFHIDGAHSGMDLDAPFEGSSQPMSSPLDSRGAYKPVTPVYGPRRTTNVSPIPSWGRSSAGGSQPRVAPKGAPKPSSLNSLNDPARLFDEDVRVTNASAPLDTEEGSDEELWAQLAPFPFGEIPDYGNGEETPQAGDNRGRNEVIRGEDKDKQLGDDHGEQVHVKVESQELPLEWDAYEGDNHDCADNGDEAHNAIGTAERASDEDEEEEEVVSDAFYDEDATGPQQSLSYVDRIHYRNSQPSSSQRSHRSSAPQRDSQKSARTRTEGEPARARSNWEWVPTQPSSPQAPSYAGSRRGFPPAPSASRRSVPHTKSSCTSVDVGASAGPGGLQVTSQARAQQTTMVPSSRGASRALGMAIRATQPGTDKLLRKPFKPPTIVNPDAKFLRECISRGSQITRPGPSGSANPSNQGKAKDATRQRLDQDDESTRHQSQSGSKSQDNHSHGIQKTFSAPTPLHDAESDSDSDVPPPRKERSSSFDEYWDKHQMSAEEVDMAMSGL